MAAATLRSNSAEFDESSDHWILPTEPTPKRRRPAAMTYAKLRQRIQLGHGTGHRDRYLPWLTLRRKNVSPNSNQVVSWMPPLGRTAHYFSAGEYHTALLLLWLGVHDLREQFPLWPSPHPHPLYGSPLLAGSCDRWSEGLLAIATKSGIKHGVEVGTRVPYVASLDLLATVSLRSGPALMAFSSKPIEKANAKVSWRTLERLELERRYAEEIGASYFVSHSALIPRLTAGQLESWLDASTLASAPELASYVPSFAECINATSRDPLNVAVKAAARNLSLPLDVAWFLFRHCCWTQAIDIDPSKRILTSKGAIPGGRHLRQQLRKRLFGETWE